MSNTNEQLEILKVVFHSNNGWFYALFDKRLFETPPVYSDGTVVISAAINWSSRLTKRGAKYAARRKEKKLLKDGLKAQWEIVE